MFPVNRPTHTEKKKEIQNQISEIIIRIDPYGGFRRVKPTEPWL